MLVVPVLVSIMFFLHFVTVYWTCLFNFLLYRVRTSLRNLDRTMGDREKTLMSDYHKEGRQKAIMSKNAI